MQARWKRYLQMHKHTVLMVQKYVHGLFKNRLEQTEIEITLCILEMGSSFAPAA